MKPGFSRGFLRSLHFSRVFFYNNSFSSINPVFLYSHVILYIFIFLKRISKKLSHCSYVKGERSTSESIRLNSPDSFAGVSPPSSTFFKRVQFLIEGLFALRKSKFQVHFHCLDLLLLSLYVLLLNVFSIVPALIKQE